MSQAFMVTRLVMAVKLLQIRAVAKLNRTSI